MLKDDILGLNFNITFYQKFNLKLTLYMSVKLRELLNVNSDFIIALEENL